MRSTLCLLVVGVVVGSSVGCRATPGFKVGWTVEVPPTLQSTVPLTPMPAEPARMYAFQGQGDVPVVTNQMNVAPMPVHQPYRLAPQVERLPMPRETRMMPRTEAGPCQSSGQPE